MPAENAGTYIMNYKTVYNYKKQYAGLYISLI